LNSLLQYVAIKLNENCGSAELGTMYVRIVNDG